MPRFFSPQYYTKLNTPIPSQSQEEWVNSVIEGVLSTERKKIALFDNFPPEYVDYYKALQEAIAKRIPDEQERPFICLNIKGSKRQLDSTTVDIGMAGGTGPLSDATALVNFVSHMSGSGHDGLQNRERVAEKMQNFSGVMYSMPPFRDLSHAYADFKAYRNLYAKARQDIPCSSLHILTNTGHSNKWVFDSSLFFGPKKYGPVDDMTEKVANKIKQESKEGDRVLILGTIAADKAKLYPNLLEARGLSHGLPRDKEPDGTDAPNYLQRIIDRAKSGKITENMPDEQRTCGQAFIDFCVKHAEKTGSNSLLFSCTEIPMLLHTEIPGQGNKTYLDHLKESLPAGKSFKFYDSEELFVEAMAGKSQELQEKPDLRSRVHEEEAPIILTKQMLIDSQAEILKNINTHLAGFQDANDEKSIHKRNVLEATRQYLQDPNQSNLQLLEKAQKDNPRYDEAFMLWGSVTLAIVQDSIEVGHALQQRQEYSSLREKLKDMRGEPQPSDELEDELKQEEDHSGRSLPSF